MRPVNILSTALLLSTTSSAWLSEWRPFEAVKREFAPLAIRQDDDSSGAGNDDATTGRQTATADEPEETGDSGSSSGDNNNDEDEEVTTTRDSDSETTDGPSRTSDGDEPKSTGGNSDDEDNSDGDNNKDDDKNDGNKDDDKNKDDKDDDKTRKYETTKTYDPRLAPGGVSMITPDIMSGSQFYKIADNITLEWEYTSVSNTPNFVDVLASCSLNDATYTIAANVSITGSTQTVTWDTGDYQASATEKLITETYTLIVHDAAVDVSQAPRPGYLGTWSQLRFGLYSPQPYTPLAQGWKCATCSDAPSAMSRHTVGFVVGMGVLTVLSFGWFAGNAGLW